MKISYLSAILNQHYMTFLSTIGVCAGDMSDEEFMEIPELKDDEVKAVCEQNGLWCHVLRGSRSYKVYINPPNAKKGEITPSIYRGDFVTIQPSI